MDDFTGTLIENVLDSGVSEDGKHIGIRLKFEKMDEAFVLTTDLAKSVFLRLGEHLAAAATIRGEMATQPAGARTVSFLLGVRGYQIAKLPGSKGLALQVQLDAGFPITLLLPEQIRRSLPKAIQQHAPEN